MPSGAEPAPRAGQQAGFKGVKVLLYTLVGLNPLKQGFHHQFQTRFFLGDIHYIVSVTESLAGQPHKYRVIIDQPSPFLNNFSPQLT